MGKSLTDNVDVLVSEVVDVGTIGLEVGSSPGQLVMEAGRETSGKGRESDLGVESVSIVKNGLSDLDGHDGLGSEGVHCGSRRQKSAPQRC